MTVSPEPGLRTDDTAILRAEPAAQRRDRLSEAIRTAMLEPGSPVCRYLG